MALNPDQEEVWKELSQDLDDLSADFKPVSLRVSYELETPADLLDALQSNLMQRRLTEEAENMAWEFIGDLVTSNQAKEVVAELPYVETPDGLEVLLVFPKSGEV